MTQLSIRHWYHIHNTFNLHWFQIQITFSHNKTHSLYYLFTLTKGRLQKKKVKLGLSAEVGGGGGSGGGPRAQPVIRLLKSKPLTALKHEKNDARPKNYLITGPKFWGEGGVRRGSAKSPSLTLFFEAFPYPKLPNLKYKTKKVKLGLLAEPHMTPPLPLVTWALLLGSLGEGFAFYNDLSRFRGNF